MLELKLRATKPSRCTVNFSTFAVLTAALVLGGCAVTPKPLTQDDVRLRVAEDKQKMFVGQEPISAPLTFSDIAARALKYNMDYRLKVMEEALAQGQLDLSSWDMFPRILANAGYISRNKDQFSSSVS